MGGAPSPIEPEALAAAPLSWSPARSRVAQYRNGATAAAWPMPSPNPLVNATDAARFEALSYAALGLAPPDGGKGDAASSPSSVMGSVMGYLRVAKTPATSEALI